VEQGEKRYGQSNEKMVSGATPGNGHPTKSPEFSEDNWFCSGFNGDAVGVAGL
jgi:hypothetical protein